ncbi:hypothetical protein QQ045_001035 [Rhodiola kirilowii]
MILMYMRMSKFCGLWTLLLMVGAMVLLLFNFNGVIPDLDFPEMGPKEHIDHVAMVTSRKLKDVHGFQPPGIRMKTKGHMVGIEDYDPIDPVPSSKTSVKHGPIQHGTPLLPYIPKPSPPGNPPSP